MTRASFDREIQTLTRLVSEMGGVAEAQITLSITAIETKDHDVAARVVAMDAQVDRTQRAIDQAVFRAMALQQPLAGDLRELLVLVQVAASIERAADHAKSIAKRIIKIPQDRRILTVGGWKDLGTLALGAFHDALDALVQRDVDKALAVWRNDGAVDLLCEAISEQILGAMEENSVLVRNAAHLLFAAKNYERIGDQATNIAERVVFLVQGTLPDLIRPKGEDIG
jgi:phosphate transport system protein